MIAVCCAVAAALALGACTSSTSTGGHAAPNTSAATTAGTPATGSSHASASPSAALPSLSSKVLTVADLPTGWSAVDVASNAATPAGCLAVVKSFVHDAEKLDVGFQASGGAPALTENLAYFTSGAQTTFAKIISTLNNCTTFAGAGGDGTQIKGTLARMSFPKLGDQSGAWTALATVQGTKVAYDIVGIRVGNYLAEVVEINVDSVNATEFKGFVDKALAKL
jgi:hypothetical protein